MMTNTKTPRNDQSPPVALGFRGTGLLFVWLLLTLLSGRASGQTALPSPVVVDVSELSPLVAQRPTPVPNQEPTVQLNLVGNVQLDAFLKLIESRLGWNFIYEAQIGERKINVRAPREVPVSALPALLGSILRMENLALVEADVPGWKRIVDSAAMLNLATPSDLDQPWQQAEAAKPMTHAFVLEHLDGQQANTVIRPFLTKAGSNILVVPESNTIIVTDFAPVLATVRKLLQLLDQPPGQARYQVYAVENLQSGKLVDQVRSMLGISERANDTASSPSSLDLFDEPRTNQVLVIGKAAGVQRALELLERFDVSLGLKTVVYRLQHVKAERLQKIMQSFIDPRDAERAFQATVDAEGNLLIVRTTPPLHRRVEELRRQIDQPIRGEESPIRFYKLKNANATDVLYTLLALQEVAGGQGALNFGSSGSPSTNEAAPSSPDANQPFSINIAPSQTQPQGFGGYNALAAMDGLQTPLLGSGLGNANRGAFANRGVYAMPPAANGITNATGSYGNIQRFGQNRRSAVLAPQLATGGVAQLPGGARVSADITTNSLVLVGPTEVQELYARLIKSLDVRRPQVMIEAKIVAVDTSGDFSLGVEISGGDREGDRRLFSFTSYGLSEVDPNNGSLTITPSLGFNGTLVDPRVADVVVKALSTNARVDVLAEPRILVNDNATGELESVTSIPFQSVNASDTVATTSLGGDQTAGTTITVTPRIKEDSHMQMEFSIEFSTFAEGGSATLPPPRQIDRIGSEITIPSGHTVIVGGLQRANESATRSGLPFIESIPIVRELTSLTTRSNSTTAFFVFLKPMILREPDFKDLKHLSAISAKEACIPPDYPSSQPLMVID